MSHSRAKDLLAAWGSRAPSEDEVRETLAALTHDERLALTTLPDLPATVLRVLAGRPEPLLASSAINHVTWWNARDSTSKESLLDSLELLGLTSDEEILGAALAFLPVPPRWTARLRRSEHLRAGVDNPLTPSGLRAKLLERLSVRRDTADRAWVAAHPSTPPALQSVLAGDADPTVAGACRAGPEILAPIEQALDEVRDPTTPPDRLVALADTPWSRVQAAVAAHRGVTPEILLRLAVHPHPPVCHAALASDRVTSPVLEALAADPDLVLRVAGHPAASAALLERLERRHGDAVRPVLVRRDRIGACRFPDLSDPDLAGTLARNPDCPLQVMDRLVETEDPAIHEALRSNPATPPDIQVRLRRRAGRTPPSIERTDPGPPRKPPPTARQEAMAREPRPGEPDAAHDLETWLSSASLARRYLALGHPDVPVPVLERAAASLCWPERLAAAVHPRTPRSVVEELASDACRWVRSSIAQDESTTVP